jgi:Cys-tRNA(Pro) deacylase
VPDVDGLPDLGVEDVVGYLSKYHIPVHTLMADTSTAEAAAQALHTDVGSIVKSLLFMHGSTPVLALVSGSRSVVLTRRAAVVGADSVRLARPREVQSETGYTVGGVPPVAHRHSLRVVMDRNLTEFPHVYAAAGSSSAIFAVRPEELRRIADADVHDIAE